MAGDTAVDPYLKEFDTDLFDPKENVVHETQNYTDKEFLNLAKKDSKLLQKYLTPPKTPRISRLKSQIMKPTFLS